MGYVDKDDSKIGTELEVDFGKKTEKVIVSKLPFVTTKYYTQKPVKQFSTINNPIMLTTKIHLIVIYFNNKWENKHLRKRNKFLRPKISI